MSSGDGAIAEATAPDVTATMAARRDALLIAGAKILVSLSVLWSGFRAISDDDFARVVIAQRFAAAPSLDPSGTSWLPLPFWLTGGVMDVFGSSIGVARATAFALGIAAAVLVHVAARWLGASRKGALAGALIACCIPYAAWLGVATVPDYPTAALILLGAAGAAAAPRRRMFASLSLAAACLSRYEAWPVAAAFALFAAWDAFRQRSWLYAASALVAAAGPIGWMLHGLIANGDALFFVKRVAAYRRAIGAAPSSWVARVFGFPLDVLRCEPETAGATLVMLVAAWRGGLAPELRRYRRAGLLLLLLLLFLIVGDLRDGAPTHHAERAVLSIWLGAAVLTGDLGVRLWTSLQKRGKNLLAVALLGTIALGAGVVRPWFARRDSFIDREPEIGVGEAARALILPGGGRVLIDTPDFGYYAIIAGLGRPSQGVPLDDRDPRHTRPPDAFASVETLHARARALHARYLIATAAHILTAQAAGEILAGSSQYVLVKLEP